MEQDQLISVIVPVYNAEKYLQRCIRSILAQTYENFEILIVDDGSKDSSGQLCDEFALQDSRIHVTHKNNGGPGSARTVGLRQAKGEYIAFVDADDYISPAYLQILHDILRKEDADLVQCRYHAVRPSQEGRLDQSFCLNSHIQKCSNLELISEFLNKDTYLNVVVLWNKLYRRELWQDLSFPEGKTIDDEFLICQVMYRAKKVAETDQVLYCYYLSPDSIERGKPSLHRLDGMMAMEEQLKFFMEIGHPEFHNALLFRYYSTLFNNCLFLKQNFPEEKQLMHQLKQKRKGFSKALFMKEIPLEDRFLLIGRRFFPGIFKWEFTVVVDP